MRLFVAADIPDGVRTRLAGCQNRLRDLPLPVRWTRPEGIHLTFFFLGETPVDRLAGIQTAVAGAAGASDAFRLEAHGVGAFPERGRPRVIVFGVGGDLDAASRLKRGLDVALGALGFRPDERAFHPHLTLGRTRDGPAGDWKTGLAGERDAEGGAFEVDHLVLFESQLGPGGSRYRAIGTFPLRPSGGTPEAAGELRVGS